MTIRQGLCGLLLVLATTALAGVETVDMLVQKHIHARGGYKVLKAAQTQKTVMEGSVFGSPLQVTTYSKRPSSYRVEQKHGGQTTVRVVNDRLAWVSMGPGMVMERPGFAARHMRESVGDFDDVLVDYNKKGHEVALEGTSKVDSRDAHKLKVSLESGAVQYVYLDRETFLILKRERTIFTPDRGEVPVVTLYGDYRPINGIMVAHAIKQEEPQPEVELKLVSTEFNIDIDDSIFKLPPVTTDRRKALAKKIKTVGEKTYLWAGGDPDGADAQWFDYTDALIPWDKLGAGIGKDCIPAIDDPLFVSPNDPRLLEIPPSPYRRDERPKSNDDIKVIGFADGDDARAYPIALLDRHELVNDAISGKPLTVGW